VSIAVGGVGAARRAPEGGFGAPKVQIFPGFGLRYGLLDQGLIDKLLHL
jgi:hypothetical protein